jgi:putative endonuclease
MTSRKKSRLKQKKNKRQVGKDGEDAAAALLLQEGFTVITTNFKTSFGEIDIIAEDGDTLCFVEVKSRSGDAFGVPAEAVTVKKQRKIAKVAAAYLTRSLPAGRTCRFDVVAVSHGGGVSKVELIRDAFRAEG